ncbi:MAG TPA: tRNA (guanosine(46)-N7)-methyltransferase TrmB [Steroidobacteraceae bacterium]|nr:tRNA (guanosine(46)-N7)-methyltransferase TrmB [Steroidobacteraceae bacterium]
MIESDHRRAIRSFVTRSGRITPAQERALEALWPKYGIELGGAPLDLDAIFGRRARRVAEIGFGNGENLLALAAARPAEDFLGIEVHRPGVGRLLLQLEQRALGNVRVLCHDAVEVLERYLQGQCLDEILILFPDPWPKKRHHKRRLIQPPFAGLLAARLKEGGALRLATDWEPYAEEMLTTLSAEARLRNVAADGGFVPRPAERSPTRFERRGERLGHQVWDLEFRRTGRTGP